MSVRLAMEEGISAGPSSGAVMHACVQIAESRATGTVVGMIFDGGSRYLSCGESLVDTPASVGVGAPHGGPGTTMHGEQDNCGCG